MHLCRANSLSEPISRGVSVKIDYDIETWEGFLTERANPSLTSYDLGSENNKKVWN